jgi:hypothetical protein
MYHACNVVDTPHFLVLTVRTLMHGLEHLLLRVKSEGLLALCMCRIIFTMDSLEQHLYHESSI